MQKVMVSSTFMLSSSRVDFCPERKICILLENIIEKCHARQLESIKFVKARSQHILYQPGKVTWTDWKPITGENAWAFLVGPLHAAYIHYVMGQKLAFVPLRDPAVPSALDILPTFEAMQSSSGAVYYAPAGTVTNQGDQLIDPYEVAVENNFSLYAGLEILRATLQATLTHEEYLSAKDKEIINGHCSWVMR